MSISKLLRIKKTQNARLLIINLLTLQNQALRYRS